MYNSKQVQFVERYENFSVSLDRLKADYELVKNNFSDGIPVDEKGDTSRIVQKILVLYKNNSYSDIIDTIPYTKTLIHQLKSQFSFNYVLYRSMYPKSCYTMHMDKSHFLHIPIITNSGCFFIFEDRLFRMPADGSAYVSNSSILHTFMNAGSEPRVHLIFETE